MSKFNEIIDGWVNYIFPNDNVEATAKMRLKLCLECDKITKKNTCKICGCFIPAKVRSEKSSCPENKW